MPEYKIIFGIYLSITNQLAINSRPVEELPLHLRILVETYKLTFNESQVKLNKPNFIAFVNKIR